MQVKESEVRGMSMYVDIRKRMGAFTLNIKFETKGERIGILGPSGCGKSMTLKCIAGIEKPDQGRIVLNGRVLFDSQKGINLSPQERKVGYLFQNYALFPHMTVEENIAMGYEGKRRREKGKADSKKRKQMEEQVQRMVTLFKLEGLEKHYQAQLSGGQQQRVALARILINEPEVLMLDEPFSALDIYLKDILQKDLLEILSLYGKDTLIVSHSRDEVYRFSERLLIVNDGELMQEGNTREVFQSPRNLLTARLTGCKNIFATRRSNDMEVIITSWKESFVTIQSVGLDTKYIGIRAHDIKVSSAGEENSICGTISSITESPFELDVFLTIKKKEDILWWKLKKEKVAWNLQVGEQIWVQLPKESIRLLK
ncbi:MAG TPA: sulfate/molybdate ABC transporter ATP-binding protein [Lachnospiraceae bacterium]|nr:sulfate/molybdate ABC transporter ATP-binding protein [Lachnospiraceae bacterium]